MGLELSPKLTQNQNIFKTKKAGSNALSAFNFMCNVVVRLNQVADQVLAITRQHVDDRNLDHGVTTRLQVH